MHDFRRGMTQKVVALFAVLAVVTFQLDLSMQVAVLSAMPVGTVGTGNDALRAEYEAYMAKEKVDSEERFRTILKMHEQNWRPIELIAPYWKQGDGFNSTIVMNNTRPREVEITAVVRTGDGKILQTRPFKIGPTRSIDVPLSSLIGNGKGVGQIALQYNGEPLEINAVLVVADRARSLSFDHSFDMAEDYASNDLEGVFYMPTSSTRSELALSNTSNQTLSVTLSVRPENETNALDEQLTLAAHKTEVVNIRPLLRGGNGQVPLAARVNLKYTGAPGDLRSHGMLQDEKGYSSNIRFLERGALGGNKVFSPVLPLGNSTSPVVVLTNTNSTPAVVHVEAYFTRNGQFEEQNLRTINAPAGGAVHLDLSADLRGLPSNASNIGLVMEHYKDGGLLADVLLIDESGSGVYQVSPKGYVGHGSHNSHSFPVRVAAGLNTIITIANPSETEEVLYSLNLYFEGKVYGAQAPALKPGEIRNINIRTLRDQQIPGARNELLPTNLASGQAELTFRRKKSNSPPAATTHKDHEAAAALGIASATLFDSEGKTSFVTCYPQCNPENWTIEVANQYYDGVIGDQFYTGITVFNINNGYFPLDVAYVNWDNNGAPYTSAWDALIQLNSPGSATLHGYVSIYDSTCDSHCSCINIFGGVIAIYVFVQSHNCTLTITEETISPGGGSLPVRNPARIRTDFAPVFEVTRSDSRCTIYWTIQSGPGTIIGSDSATLVTIRGDSTGTLVARATTNTGNYAQISVPVVNQQNVDVRVYIFRQDNGTNAAITSQGASDYVADANLIWQQCGIQFNLVSTSYIDNTAGLTPSSVGRDVIRDFHQSTGGIEIYFVDSFSDSSATGETSIDGIVVNDNANSRTVAHELGHAMDLSHGGTANLHLMHDTFSEVKADIKISECNALSQFSSN